MIVDKRNNYRQYLKNTLGGLIDKLTVSDLRKEFLKHRWLDQLLWLESRAKKEQKRYYVLRLITIIGGTLVPAMVGFNGFQGSTDNRFQTAVAYAAFGVSQTVAISAAIEEFFAYGKKYRNYRNTAENLKIEGWQFFQLAGPYRQYVSHEAAYSSFAQRVEQYMQQDVKGFLVQFEENQENTQNGRQADIDQNAQMALQQLNLQRESVMQSEQPLPEAYAPFGDSPNAQNSYPTPPVGTQAYRSSEIFLSQELPDATFDPAAPLVQEFFPEEYQPLQIDMPSEIPSSEILSSDTSSNRGASRPTTASPT